MEFLSNPTPLIKLETIFGAFFYLIGVLGSYYRFKLHKRREKIDALCMICMTWGAAAITVSIGWVIKHTAVPSLHFELYRFLWYAGAFVTSMVFLTKDFKSAFIRTRLGANLLLASMILVFFDALVFYFELPLEAAVCSCIGVVIFFIANLFQKKNIAYLGLGMLLFILPIFPIVKKQELTFDQMNQKRELAIKELLEKENATIENDHPALSKISI